MSDTSMFDYVICVTPDGRHYDRAGKITISAPFNDTPLLPTPEYLSNIVGLTLWCMERGTTLVQCSAGLNRSGLIVGLVLVTLGLDARAAVDHMRKVRSESVLSNENFYHHVLKFVPNRSL